MIASVVALTLAAAAQNPAAQNPGQAATAVPRQAYYVCMGRFLRAQLRASASENAFDTAIATACPQEEAAFRAALVAANRAAGDNAADAARYADEDIDGYKDNEKERFRTYKEYGTVPD